MQNEKQNHAHGTVNRVKQMCSQQDHQYDCVHSMSYVQQRALSVRLLQMHQWRPSSPHGGGTVHGFCPAIFNFILRYMIDIYSTLLK
jgi:hypothetical protein